jgi:transposase
MTVWYHQAQQEPTLSLLCGDSAVVSLLPTITRCWTRIGQQRTIATPGVKAEKQWDWGAVDVVTGQTVHLLHPRRHNVGFRRLLAAIARQYQLADHPERQIILVLDNDKAHKAKVVQRLLAKHNQQIRLEWLPAYSPELNPQEDIWQHMRRRVTHNYFFEAMQRMSEAIHEFHEELQSCPQQVLQLISKWTHIISS